MPAPNRVVNKLQEFVATPLDTVLQQHRTVPGGVAALQLFQSVAANVPAYGEFLSEHGIVASEVCSPEHFATLPFVTKENYLQRYPLASLCRDGALQSCDMIAVSSGSTGRPTFWPRFITDELSVARRFEQVFHDSFEANTKPTLAVVCFALGTWVGGMYTASSCRHLAAKGYPITVITPGNNKGEIYRVVRELGPMFEQVVLLGYPPFLKDVIDSGPAESIDWKQHAIKLVMAGEVFSEEWRDLVGERAGMPDACYNSASLYGTADAGVLGNETPLSICIRRFLAGNPTAARELFGESRLPTLVQYDPLNRYFETHENTLLFTGDNGIPLIRYHISDTGGIISYEAMLQFLRGHGFDPLTQFAPGARGVRDLPFVYVFGRSHFTVSYFGANIYPENVTVGLEQPAIKEWVTGKFVLQAHEDEDRNRYLQIAVELAPGVEASDDKARAAATSIRAQLLRLNSEFAHYVPADFQMPRIELYPAGDPTYFPVGVKHRYTRQ